MRRQRHLICFSNFIFVSNEKKSFSLLCFSQLFLSSHCCSFSPFASFCCCFFLYRARDSNHFRLFQSGSNLNRMQAVQRIAKNKIRFELNNSTFSSLSFHKFLLWLDLPTRNSSAPRKCCNYNKFMFRFSLVWFYRSRLLICAIEKTHGKKCLTSKRSFFRFQKLSSENQCNFIFSFALFFLSLFI